MVEWFRIASFYGYEVNHHILVRAAFIDHINHDKVDCDSFLFIVKLNINISTKCRLKDYQISVFFVQLIYHWASSSPCFTNWSLKRVWKKFFSFRFFLAILIWLSIAWLRFCCFVTKKKEKGQTNSRSKPLIVLCMSKVWSGLGHSLYFYF